MLKVNEANINLEMKTWTSKDVTFEERASSVVIKTPAAADFEIPGRLYQLFGTNFIITPENYGPTYSVNLDCFIFSSNDTPFTMIIHEFLHRAHDSLNYQQQFELNNIILNDPYLSDCLEKFATYLYYPGSEYIIMHCVNEYDSSKGFTQKDNELGVKDKRTFRFKIPNEGERDVYLSALITEFIAYMARSLTSRDTNLLFEAVSMEAFDYINRSPNLFRLQSALASLFHDLVSGNVQQVYCLANPALIFANKAKKFI